MIKLFSLKQQKKDGDATAERGKKASAAQLRIHKGKSLTTDECESWPIRPKVFYVLSTQVYDGLRT